MFGFSSTGSNGHDRASWRVLLLLAAAVLAPTAAALWFMNAAIGNERLLVRQRLVEAYRNTLALAGGRLTDSWDRRIRDLEQAARREAVPSAFGAVVREKLADAIVCYDKSGRIAYPAPARLDAAALLDRAAWDRAAELEYSKKDLVGAAAAYAAIAAGSRNEHEAARALGAQSRCLLRAGNKTAVLDLVTREFASPRFARSADAAGRVIAVDQELLAVQTLGAASLRSRLQARLADYDNPAIPSEQRRFAMRELASLGVKMPELEAEDLAARWVAANPNPMRDSSLRRSPAPAVWQMSTLDGRAVALFRDDTLRGQIQGVIDSLALPKGVTMSLISPDAAAAGDSTPVHSRLPDWRVGLSWNSGDLLDAESNQRAAWYLWVGGLGVAAIAILGLFALRAVRRQMRIARLKNDLVATVSHELKTPLSSMRLLVDTLLESSRLDPARTREYLELISTENGRLSRLIDNFLTFSRIERNKQNFHFRDLKAEEVVRNAAAAMGERLQPPSCEFTADVDPSLPAVKADPDGLVTVLVNLLDNAWKYTEGDRRIQLRAFAENGSVCFAVKDNGIGLAPGDRKRVFDRFYQADQRMTRRAGGCGLGLSIVDHIVKAHGGSIKVDSALGSGSTFTVVLPAGRH